MKDRRIPASYVVTLMLGGILFLGSGAKQGYRISDLLFSLGSGALIVGIVILLGNLKMFASAAWGTRMLKRIFLNRMRSGREETEDYLSFRNRPGRRTEAIPLLAVSAVLIVLSFICSKLT